jgi:diguanylate cyclase (GGDEF)-like protein/PAS domain S-box-containing protein
MNPFDLLRRRGDAAVRTRTEDTFRVLAEITGEAVVRADAAGHITYLNPVAQRLFGYPPSEAQGQPLNLLLPERFHEAQGRAWGDVVAGAVSTLVKSEQTLTALRRDGAEIPVELRLSGGTLDGVVFVSAVFRDLSGGRALGDSEHFLALAETLPAMVFVFQDDVIRYANPAAGAITGYRRQELVGMPFWQPFHPDHRSVVRDRGQARQQGQPAIPRYEARLLTKDGTDRWVDFAATTITLDGRPAGLAAAVDITDQRLAEGAVRESDRRIRDILENVQLIALTLDREGAIIFANEYLLELIGYGEEEVVGRDWFELAVPAERRPPLRQNFEGEMASGTVAPHHESDIVTRLGERRLVSWNNTVLQALSGEVSGIACLGVDVTERRRVEEQLVHDAFHDALTGLPNRALFMDRLGSALARSVRKPQYLFAVLFLDVDRFKTVNDSLGHRAGDQLLIQISRALAGVLRPGDTVARLGGDEFTILLDDLASTQDALRVAERIRESLAQPFTIGGHQVFSTVSIGIALSSPRLEQPEELLRNADTAMYHAKADGRGTYKVFDTSMHALAISQLETESDLRRAVERQGFLLHFQPIVEMATGRVTGMEALVRWEHSKRGLVSPLEFVHLAEETGLIYEIGSWALAEACRALRAWGDGVGDGFTMSVNLSTRQFNQPDLVDTVAAVLNQAGLDPGRLKLEVTESVLMSNAEAAVITMRRLHDLGVHVCIDDFGTGYSSLSYLLRLPADTLKIDRSFVVGMAEGARHAELVGTIVALGRSLGMEVVAEGVETADQRDRLLALECPFAQGFFYARPMDAERARAWLTGQNAR